MKFIRSARFLSLALVFSIALPPIPAKAAFVADDFIFSGEALATGTTAAVLASLSLAVAASIASDPETSDRLSLLSSQIDQQTTQAWNPALATFLVQAFPPRLPLTRAELRASYLGGSSQEELTQTTWLFFDAIRTFYEVHRLDGQIHEPQQWPTIAREISQHSNLKSEFTGILSAYGIKMYFEIPPTIRDLLPGLVVVFAKAPFLLQCLANFTTFDNLATGLGGLSLVSFLGFTAYYAANQQNLSTAERVRLGLPLAVLLLGILYFSGQGFGDFFHCTQTGHVRLRNTSRVAVEDGEVSAREAQAGSQVRIPLNLSQNPLLDTEAILRTGLVIFFNWLLWGNFPMIRQVLSELVRPANAGVDEKKSSPKSSRR